MSKYFYFLSFFLITTLCCGQNISFEANINHKAKSLKQGLNKNGDSLILESTKKPIQQVDIFNDDILESYDVNAHKTKIDLNVLPAGNFIVQARVGKKRIIMSLEKKDGVNIAMIRLKEKMENEHVDSLISIPNRKLKKKIKLKNPIYYWVVYESNSNFGARKSMKLVYKNELPELIEKNKFETQSKVAQNNSLRIYAIYDKNKFMKKQFRNPKYYKSVKKSKIFNTVPYYDSTKE